MKLVNSFFLFVVCLLSGCTTLPFIVGPIVTGIIYWSNGEASKYYEERPVVVYRATKNVLNQLAIPITKDEVKNNVYYLEAGTDSRFSIHIEPSEHGLTKFSNRINFLGDKELAELIYKKVDETLDVIHFDNQGNPTKKKKWQVFN